MVNAAATFSALAATVGTCTMLAACSTGSSVRQALPQTPASAIRLDSLKPTSSSRQSDTIVWQAGSSTLGHYKNATTYQCGAPSLNGTSFTFELTLQGTSCGRNQAQPTIDDSGDLLRLQEGRQYTFSFTYIDGTPSNSGSGMGYDADARSLIWQIHPFAGGTPCTGLSFDNGGWVGGKQEWSLGNCNGTVWRGSYTPHEIDHWVIQVLVSQTSAGYIKLFRNGAALGTFGGATFTNSRGGSGDPWFNFGPYKWRWELADSGSTTKTVNATFNDFVVTTP